MAVFIDKQPQASAKRGPIWNCFHSLRSPIPFACAWSGVTFTGLTCRSTFTSMEQRQMRAAKEVRRHLTWGDNGILGPPSLESFTSHH